MTKLYAYPHALHEDHSPGMHEVIASKEMAAELSRREDRVTRGFAEGVPACAAAVICRIEAEGVDCRV